MGAFGDPDAWKSEPDNIWQDGFERLGFRDQCTIREIADEKFNGDIIQAMQYRFKNNVGLALSGRLPKDWQIFSDDERRSIAEAQREMQSDPGLRSALENLFTGLDGYDDDTELPPIKKNSGPKKT